jgi:hypothetical protein
MIAFAVQVHQLGLKIDANLGENMSQLLDSVAVEDAAAVFGHKDQMDVHCKNTMSAMSKIIAS